jgi:hypothetical protein
MWARPSKRHRPELLFSARCSPEASLPGDSSTCSGLPKCRVNPLGQFVADPPEGLSLLFFGGGRVFEPSVDIALSGWDPDSHKRFAQ